MGLSQYSEPGREKAGGKKRGREGGREGKKTSAYQDVKANTFTTCALATSYQIRASLPPPPACSKCRLSGPAPDMLDQRLHFDAVPSKTEDSCTHWSPLLFSKGQAFTYHPHHFCISPQTTCTMISNLQINSLFGGKKTQLKFIHLKMKLCITIMSRKLASFVINRNNHEKPETT